MIDSVLKGTGNSRFLKSAVPAGTSWADALAMLQAGTFPIDFNGINAEGFQQVGTPMNKANLLKDATAAQIGLPPSTTPDGMFQALGNTGELHVWRKTVVSSSEQPAGYTLGDVITNSEIWVENSNETVFHYATSISVSDIGLVSLVGEKTATIGHAYSGENIAEFDVFKGKFVYISGGDNNKRPFIFYIPANATFYRNGTYGTNKIYADKEQRVNAHGIIPPGTTTTYPVSTNPNAYQDGSDAKEAGYTLGEVVTSKVKLGYSRLSSGMYYYYADTLSVSDDGKVSISTQNSYQVNRNSTTSDLKTAMTGKFIQLYASSGSAMELSGPFSTIPGEIVFIPADTSFATETIRGDEYFTIDRYQPVTGYAAIPAGTTIEYLGKLGDKARVQVVSYVGTGTNSSETPNSLVFDFAPKIVFILGWINTDSNFCQGMLSPLLDHGFCIVSGYSGYGDSAYLTVKSSGNKITWTGKDSYYQLNESGAKYYAVAIG